MSHRHGHRLRHLTAALKTTRVRTLALAAIVACLFSAAYLPQILRLPMVPGASSPFSSSAIIKPSSGFGAKETGTAPSSPQRPHLSSERAREEGVMTSRIPDAPSLHSGVDTTPPGSNVGFCTEQYYLPPPFFVANEARKGNLNEHGKVNGNENEQRRESDQSTIRSVRSFPCPLRGVQYSHRTAQQVFGGPLDPRSAPTRPWCAIPVGAAPSFARNADGKASHEKNKIGEQRRPEEEPTTGRDKSLSTPYADFLQKSEVFAGAKLQTVAVEHDMRRWMRQKAYPELFWHFFVTNVSVEHPHQSPDNTHNENKHNHNHKNEQKSNDVGKTTENPRECGQVLSENPDLSYVTAATAAVEFSRHQTTKPSSNRNVGARSPHHEELPKTKGNVHEQAHRPHGQSKHAEQHHATRSKRLELVPPVKAQGTPRDNPHGRKVLEHGAARSVVSGRKQLQCRGLVNPCSWSPRTPPSRPDRTTSDLRQLIDVADAVDCAVPDTMPRRATVHHMMKMNAARSVSPNDNEKETPELKKKESGDSKGKATENDGKPVSRSKSKRIDTWRREDLSLKISPLFGHDAGNIPEAATVAAQAIVEHGNVGDHTDMKQRREVQSNSKEVYAEMAHHDHSHVDEQTEAAKVLFGPSGTQLKPTRVSREGSYLKIDNVCMRCERRQPNRKFLPAGRECGTTLYSIGAHSADLQFELLSPRSNNRHKLFVDREQAFQYGGVLYELNEGSARSVKSTDAHRPRKNTSASESPEKPEKQEGREMKTKGEDQSGTKKEGKEGRQSLFDVRLIQNDPTASQPSRKMFSIGVRLQHSTRLINDKTTAADATEKKRFAAEVKNQVDAESRGKLRSATMIHHVSGCTVYAAPFTVANVGHVLHDYVAGFATALHRCVFGFPSYLSKSTDGRTSNNANQDSRKERSTVMNQQRGGVEAQGMTRVPPARVLMDYDFAKLTSPYAQLLTNITAHELLQLAQNHGGSSSGVTSGLMVRTPQAQQQQRGGSKRSREQQNGQHNGKERRSAGSHGGSTVFGFPSTVTAAERALFDDDEPFTCFESLLVSGMDRGLARSLVEKKAVVRTLRRAVHRLLPEVVPATLFTHDDQSSRKLKTSPSNDARGNKPKSDSAKVDDERIVGAPPAAAPPKTATDTTSTKSKDAHGKVKAPKTPKPTPAPWVDDHMTGRLRDLFSIDSQKKIHGGLSARHGHDKEGGGHAHHDDRSIAKNTVKNIERVKPQMFVYGRNDVERRSIDNIGFLFTAVSAMARSYSLPPPAVITTLEMPVSQQLRLFSSMDVLVSMQGAHLEQTVFMLAPDAIVIELVPCQGRKTSFIKAHGKLFEPHTHAQIELCRPALSLSELEVQPQNVTLCPHHAGVVARLLEPHLRLMLHGRGLL